ncbi:hypothetical protein AX17_004363 [Amanita inopinata Kibby_2008]|nr:hypothetical protein AX17_004363 [Amanita inopinata Kibby_2008]
MAVINWLNYRASGGTQAFGSVGRVWNGASRRTLNIPAQLKALGLGEFQGRQHSGIDDSRNISRILAELARRGITLKPNTTINPNKRWYWMGKNGQILNHVVV